MVIGLFAPLLASGADLSIPSQPLGTSLQDLGKMSGLQISFRPDVVDGREAPALNGNFTVEVALDTLLAGTGLTYHVLDTEAIEVVGTPIDEVEVIGSHEKLSAMVKEYEKVEDQFYELYNTLNTDAEYTVSCGEGESHDIRRKFILGGKRNCVPRFVEKAQRDEVWGLIGSSGASRRGGVSMTAILVIAQKTPDYQKNMAALVRKNPKLLELLMKRGALEQRYQDARKQKFEGGKIFVWD
jgi:hypothetical protein